MMPRITGSGSQKVKKLMSRLRSPSSVGRRDGADPSIYKGRGHDLKKECGQNVGNKKTGQPASSRKCRSDLFWLVRPEGFEPPAYWSVAGEHEVVCQCGHADWKHNASGDCSRCSCRGWYGPADETDDEAFWGIVGGVHRLVDSPKYDH